VVDFLCSVSEEFLHDPLGSIPDLLADPVNQTRATPTPRLRVFDFTPPLRLELIDPREARLWLQDVQMDDPDSVLSFLNRVGYYGPMRPPDKERRVIEFQGEDGPHVYGYRPLVVTLDELCEIQRYCREWPCHLTESNLAGLEARVAPAGGMPSLFVTTASFCEALYASFAFDQVERARRARCGRPNCGRTFTYTGKRQRKYCTQECARYMAVIFFRQRQEKPQYRKVRGRKGKA